MSALSVGSPAIVGEKGLLTKIVQTALDTWKRLDFSGIQAGPCVTGSNYLRLCEQGERHFGDRAALVAAITCSRPGADPPTRAEVDAVLAAGHP